MGNSAGDVVPLTLARAKLCELADQAKAVAEKVITKSGESYVPLIDAARLDYYHRLERERIHLLLIDDARRGLADIAAGRSVEADGAIAQLQQRRKAAAKASRPASSQPRSSTLAGSGRPTDEYSFANRSAVRRLRSRV